MQKFKFLIYCIFILSFAYACNSLKEDINEIYNIIVPTDSPIKNAKLSSYVDTHKFITLETSKDNLVGSITKVLVHKNYLYVLDRNSSKSVFLFDITGKFIQKIGVNGDGVGGYTFPLDMTIDEENEQLLIIDGGSVLLSFSLNGKYIGKKSLTDISGASSFCILPNKKVAWIAGGTSPNLCITNINLGEKECYFPYTKRDFESILFNSLASINKQAVVYRRNLNDTLFNIVSGAPKPLLYINYGAGKITSDKLSKILTEANPTEMLANIASTFMVYTDLHHSFGVFTYKQKNCLFIHSHKSQKTVCLDFNSLNNDISFDKVTSYPVGINSQKGEFIFYIDTPQMLKGLAGADKSTENYKKIAKIAQKLDKNSNPVLMFVKWKDNF